MAIRKGPVRPQEYKDVNYSPPPPGTNKGKGADGKGGDITDALMKALDEALKQGSSASQAEKDSAQAIKDALGSPSKGQGAKGKGGGEDPDAPNGVIISITGDIEAMTDLDLVYAMTDASGCAYVAKCYVAEGGWINCHIDQIDTGFRERWNIEAVDIRPGGPGGPERVVYWHVKRGDKKQLSCKDCGYYQHKYDVVCGWHMHGTRVDKYGYCHKPDCGIFPDPLPSKRVV